MAGSLLGGPMAMVYLLWKNFQVLEDPHGMRQILIWGSIFIIMMIGFAPLLPTSWPDYALPIGYSLAALVAGGELSNVEAGDRRDRKTTNFNPVGMSSPSPSRFCSR